MTALHCLITIGFTLGTLLTVGVRDVRAIAAWSVVAALVATTFRPRHSAILEVKRVRTRSSRISRSGWRYVLSGVVTGLLMSAVILITPALNGIGAWFTVLWQNRDRETFEIALARLERTEQWREATTTIDGRLRSSVSPGWRASLESRQFHSQLEEAVRHANSRPALEDIRKASRVTGFSNRIVSQLLEGLDTADRLRALQEDWHRLKDEMAEERRGLATAHLSQLLRHANELELYPFDTRVLLDEALLIARQHDLTVPELESHLQEWRPPQTLPPGTRLELTACTQRGLSYTLDISVVAPSGDPIDGLTMRDFRLLCDGLPYRRYGVWSSQETVGELSIGIALDHSASTTGAPLQSAVAGLSRMADSFSGRARLKLWTFATDVRAATDWDDPSSTLVARISATKSEGNTALLRGLDSVVSNLKSQTGRRLLVLFSDGKDTVGGPPLSAIIERCRSHDIAVHVVALQTPDIDRPLLQLLADHTGGQLVVVDRSDELLSAFERLREAMDRPIYRVTVLCEDSRERCFTLQVGSQPVHTLEVCLPHKSSPHTGAR